MSKTPTFQELLVDYSDRTFIGRHTYLALFHYTFVAPRPPFLILNIYGQAGIGKTILLHELDAVARDYEALTAVTTALQTSIPQVIHHLLNQFADHQPMLVNLPPSDNHQALSHHFVASLNRLASQRQLVLCFDDYDQTAATLDHWLRDLLVGKFGAFSSQILFVIASRQPLGLLWMAFHYALHQIELEAFSEQEARAYMRQTNITDPKTVAHLLQRSQGVPGVLAALVAQYGQLTNSGILWQRGRTHFKARAYSLALAEFNRAIELQPANDYLYHWRGRTYWEANDHSSALADFTRAIELQPERVTYYHWRGLAYRKTHDYLSALADFSQAIQLQPQNGDNYWARGYTYQEAHNYPAAVSDFTKAIELQPENINFYYWRGRSYLEMKDTAQAWADFAHIKDILRQKKQTTVHSNGSS
jgi:tetratricopeptide (TPR) repeat protein